MRPVAVLLALLALLVAVPAASAAPACTTTFTATGGGAWSDGANWSGGTAPSGADDACIPSGLTGPVVVSAVPTVGSLQVGGPLSVSGVLTVTGDVEVTAGAALSGIGLVIVRDALRIVGGTSTLAVRVTDGGTVTYAVPGATSGTSSVVYTRGAVQVAGDVPDGHVLTAQQGTLDAVAPWTNRGQLLVDEGAITGAALTNLGMVVGASGGGGPRSIAQLDNRGVVAVHAGATLRIAHLAGAEGGVLPADGTYSLAGTLQLDQGPFTENRARLSLGDAGGIVAADGTTDALATLTTNTGRIVIGGGSHAVAGALAGHGELVVGPGATFTVGGAYVHDGDDLRLDGELRAPTVRVAGDARLIAAGGTLDGDLENAGEVVAIDPNNGGPGVLAIDGDYTQDAAGELTAIIDGAAASRLEVTGAARLAGSVQQRVQGADPEVCAVLPLVTAQSRTGRFADVAGNPLPAVSLVPRYGPRSAALAAIGPPDPPRDVTITAVEGGVTATWAPPEEDGCTALTAYGLAARPVGATDASQDLATRVGVDRRTATLTGLRPGVEYDVAVVAYNGGMWSGSVLGKVRPLALPAQPPTPPTPPASGPAPAPPVRFPVAARDAQPFLRSVLARLARPVRTRLRRGAVRARVTSPVSGTLRVEVRAGRTVVARGSRRLSGGRPATVKLTRTDAARRLLRRGTKVMTSASFTPADGSASARGRRLALR